MKPLKEPPSEKIIVSHRKPRSPAKLAAQKPQLELYQKEECPFSHLVRRRLSDLGLDYVAHSVPANHPLKHEQLIQAGGKDQVPFLIDHRTGTKLYESEAIVKYLDSHYAERQVGQESAKPMSKVTRKKEILDWTYRAGKEKIEQVTHRVTDVTSTLTGGWRLIRDSVMRALNVRTGDREVNSSPQQ
jgi:glutaredoxin